jgi:hypothetical protein
MLGRPDKSSTASVKVTLQGRHSNVRNSARPPNRGVTRASVMGWPQLGQRGVLATVPIFAFYLEQTDLLLT